MTFVCSTPSSETTGTCLIAPIGDFDKSLLNDISYQILKVFKLEAFVQTLLASIDFAFDNKRNQYHSTAILDRLVELLKPEFKRVIAITSSDLFIPILTHVYGEAKLGGKACIVSTARLNEGLESEPDQVLFRERVVKEALHELGHTYNLIHCKDARCIMHYCRSIGDVDEKDITMCRYCSVLLSDEMKRNQV